MNALPEMNDWDKLNYLIDKVDELHPDMCNGTCNGCLGKPPYDDCVRNVLAHAINEISEEIQNALGDSKVKEFAATLPPEERTK